MSLEIQTAIHGECMWFAMALQNFLKARQIECGLAVAAHSKMRCNWSHVMMVYSKSYYDIRGKLNIKTDVHKEYRTKRINLLTRTELREDLQYYTNNDVNKFVAKWHQRLIA